MLYAALAGVAARLALAFTGVGRDVLAWRVEVATAANSPLELREGLALYRLGVSPYAGSSCRTPPLALWLYGAAHGPASGVPSPTAELVHALPNIALDLLTAMLLSRVAKQLFSYQGRKQANSGGGVAGTTTSSGSASLLPGLVAWVYLLNPFSLMAAAAGTTSPLEAAGVAAALYGAVVVAAAGPAPASSSGSSGSGGSRWRGLALAALGLAVATHAALHCVVLLLPLACLLAVGPEDVATPLRRLCVRSTLSGGAAGGGCGGGGGGGGRWVLDTDGALSQGEEEQQEEVEARKDAWLRSLPTEEQLMQRQAGGAQEAQGSAGASAAPELAEAEQEPLRRPGLAKLKLPDTPTTPITPGGREFPPPSAGAREDGGGPAGAGGGSGGGGKHAKAEFDALTRWLRQPLLPWRQLVRCGGLAFLFWLLLALVSDVYLLPVSSSGPPSSIGGSRRDATGVQAPAACAVALAGPLLLQPPPAMPGADAAAATVVAGAMVLRLGPLELPLPPLPPAAAAALAAARARLAAAGAAAAGCWAGRVYGSQVLLDDVAPNVGQWWYLAMEAFDDAKPYVRILAHSLLLAMAPPLALRLGRRRPLALFIVLQLALGLLRPYPSVADLGLSLALLPLLARQQGAALRLGLLLPASLLLLAVLGPAMLRMWLHYESANSNFFYSITLLYGVWQVLLLGQALGLTLRVDRIARGKEALEPEAQVQVQVQQAAAHAS